MGDNSVKYAVSRSPLTAAFTRGSPRSIGSRSSVRRRTRSMRIWRTQTRDLYAFGALDLVFIGEALTRKGAEAPGEKGVPLRTLAA